jgi:hypothetical protein
VPPPGPPAEGRPRLKSRPGYTENVLDADLRSQLRTVLGIYSECLTQPEQCPVDIELELGIEAVLELLGLGIAGAD